MQSLLLQKQHKQKLRILYNTSALEKGVNTGAVLQRYFFRASVIHLNVVI